MTALPIPVTIPKLGDATTPLSESTDRIIVSQSGVARDITLANFISQGNGFARLTANTFTGAQTINNTLRVNSSVTAYTYQTLTTFFPPLTGGTTLPTLTSFRSNFSGYILDTGAYNTFGSASDSVAMIRGAGGGINYLGVEGRLISGYNGGRAAVDGNIIEPSTAVTTQIRASRGMVGGKFAVSSNNNVGGIATGFGTSFFGWGNTYALNTQTLIGVGGTYRRGVVGYEMDLNVASGASFASGYGLLVVLTTTHEVQGAKDWAALQLSTSNATSGAGNWKTGLAIGSYSSGYPIHTTGTLIKGYTGNTYKYIPSVAAGGFDVREVDFSNHVIRWNGGDIQDGSYGGSAQVGYAKLSSLVTGADLSTTVTKSTAVAINTAGSGYSTNDIVKTAQDVYIKITSRIVVNIDSATQANPVVITSAAHGLSNGTIFDVSVDDPESGSGSATAAVGMEELQVQTITGITNANPAVLTVTNHGLANDTWVRVSSVGGMTQMNGNPYYIVKNRTTNTFTLQFPNGTAVDSTNWDTYTSAGTVRVTYKVTNATANTFELYTEQNGAVNGTGWSAYVSGGRVLTYIPDAIEIFKPGWETSGSTTNVATEALVRNGRQYGSGLTVNLTWTGVTPLNIQSNTGATYVGGTLAGAATTAGVRLQTRQYVQATTATVNTITVVDGGEFGSAPTLVVAAPADSGSTATATVATLGARTAISFTGGTLYNTNQILTLVGGTSTQTAQYRVVSVDDEVTGVPTQLALYRAGSYSVLPASPVSATGGTGSGLTITPGWTILTANVTGAGSNYPEYPLPTVTTSGGSKVNDAAFTVAMTATEATMTLQPSGSLVLAAGSVTVTKYLHESVGNALTAAGTTRADALQLAKQVNRITTAAASTGVILPVGVVGMIIYVFNAGANPVKVYASASETIDGNAGSTGVTLTNALRCTYTFVAANTWISAQLGVVSA